MRKGKGKRRYDANRQKHWRKECARRQIKLKKMKELPIPQPIYCTDHRNELLETWNGFKKTVTTPHIYYKTVDQNEKKEFESFNESWRQQFVAACRGARSGRQPVAVRFRTIPAYEGKARPRIEPTAMAGYEIYKRDNNGIARDDQLMHVRFYYREREARASGTPHPKVLPQSDWRECPRTPGKCASLHTRFRTSGAGRKLMKMYRREFPEGFGIELTNAAIMVMEEETDVTDLEE